MEWQSMMWHDYLSLAVGVIGVAIIVIGVIVGLWEFSTCQYRALRGKNELPLDDIRYDMGRYLLLGLEFLIAADVIHTVIQPTLEQVAVLGAIVIIRTIITYFLNREMAHVGKYHK
jgi:uncharacterized membrane protein